MTDASRERLDIFVTVLATAIAVMAAVGMADHVRLVDAIVLFFSGVGTGAGLARVLHRRRSRRVAA
jgi:hypothetical protein